MVFICGSLFFYPCHGLSCVDVGSKPGQSACCIYGRCEIWLHTCSRELGTPLHWCKSFRRCCKSGRLQIPPGFEIHRVVQLAESCLTVLKIPDMSYSILCVCFYAGSEQGAKEQERAARNQWTVTPTFASGTKPLTRSWSAKKVLKIKERAHSNEWNVIQIFAPWTEVGCQVPTLEHRCLWVRLQTADLLGHVLDWRGHL